MVPRPVPIYRQKPVMRLIIVALLGEIGYAVLNISTMQVYLRDDRGFGEGLIGLVLVAFLLSEALCKGPMGHRADRFGPKMLMTVGPALSVGTALLSLAVPRTGGTFGEVLAFILLRAVDGVGAAMLWPAAYAYVGEAADDNNRQQAMSWLNLCYMLGIALALPIGGVINDITHTHWASLILAAGLFLAVSLTVHFLLPDTTIRQKHTGESSLEDLIRSVKAIPAYLLLAVITFAGIGFPMAIIKLFAADQFQMSESAFGALVLPAAALMAAASVPMSKFGEKIGRIKSVHVGMSLCTLGMTIIAGGAFAPVLRAPWALALGSLPVGIGFLLAIPAWMASVSDIDCNRRGANLGAVMTAQGLGAIVGAPLGGLAYHKLGPLGRELHLGQSFARYSPFVGCAICVGLGWVIGLNILKEKQGPDATCEINPGT
jgi:MFS family permease